MTKRTPWPMVVPAGTKTVGTAHVRDEARPAMTAAQRRIFEATGNRPQVDSGFDEIADGFDPDAPIPLSMQKPTKPAKYRNTKCEQGGIKFDSQKECSRWVQLTQLQVCGHIRDLQLQVPYVLTERKQRDDGKWERASKYVADFVYIDAMTGKQVVEDVKSAATRKDRTYIQKRKQMLDKYDISIREV
ncbi:DUF1064 domain-containing protein [Burkholderia sp. TSV86]|uniref:DUF1064 domain-containing protein n=1 Tax=Burkholderia sp. TSV86 TaxID=1385594 RepID=UPI00076CEBBF|nr:DUF1064 domain-containing protein [Burkholderia sp. TSV86]KVE32254.1 hypothetical protein WS68_16515 [Burkholderia sp. TSV86]